jgi:acyl-CoA synthetase (AMP-forming)/AMP-acid ligase II
MNAAEPVRTDTHLRFQTRFAAYGLDPQTHVVAYGLAENTLAATHYGRNIVAVDKRRLRNHEAVIVDNDDGDSRIHLASCGRPLDGISVRIVDPQSHAVLPDRAIGEIWLSGGSVCRGYWGRPELTREVFENALLGDEATPYLRTGDLGFMHDGELFVSGRMKDLIILRGANVYPQDIETAVESVSSKICGVAAFAGNGTDAASNDAFRALRETSPRRWTVDPASVDAFLTRSPDFVLEEPGFPFNEGLVRNRVTYWPKSFLKRR